VVVAGGTARRWGGVDKTAVELGGRAVLLHVLEALPRGVPAVVVAPADHAARAAAEIVGRPVLWTREDPPGGGPVAALAAALAVPVVRAADVAVVLAGDLPFARPAVPRLLAALTERDGTDLDAALDEVLDAAVGVDESGRRQPLLAAYRLGPLRAAVAALGGRPPGRPPGPWTGRALREVLAGLRVVEVPVSVHEAFDLDTPADLEAARVAFGLRGEGPLQGAG
jgi:molybdopterin-guanine dinucleotide biosynthesis protein A